MASERAPRSGPRRSRSGAAVPCLRVALGVIAVWASLVVVSGDALTPVRIGIYAAPWMTAGTLAVGIGCLLCRKWWDALAGAGLCAGLVIWQWPVAAQAVIPPGAQTVSVMALSNRTGNPDMATTARFIEAHPADIVALQEVADPAALRAALPDWQSCVRGGEMIFSRFPVAPAHPGSGAGQLLCEVETPAGPVLTGSVHLPKAHRDRVDQDRALTHLEAVLATTDLPVLLAGDFNTTPRTSAYARLRGMLTDSHAVAGKGLGFSFPTPARPLLSALGPLVRIDFVFHGPAFATVSSEVLRDHPPAADHYPVRAVLAWTGT